MTDSTSWQPPVGGPTPQQPSPFAAPPAAPGLGTPPGPGTSPGWTPPPKPGLIPLRPLGFGTLLGAAFQVLRRNPRATFGFALLVNGLTYLIGILVVGLVIFASFSRVASATGSEQDTIAAGAVGLTVLSALVPVALSIVGSAIVQGVIALEVARGTLGEKLRLRGLLRAARGRIGVLIGWAAALAGVAFVALALIGGIIALLIAFGGVAGIVIAVLLGLLAGAVFIAAAFWLTTKLALVPSALVLERLTLRAAIARSWSLTTGFFWKTLGTLLLVNVIISFVSSVISTPLQFIASIGGSLLNPTGDQTAVLITAGVVYVLVIVFTVIFGAIGLVVQSSTPALIYLDIRMRKEGLDLELTRYVEARQAGNTTVANPYLTAASPAAPPAGP